MAGVEVTAESRPATPLWWLLFSAGGVMSAFFMPVTVFLTSIAVAADWLDEEELLDAVRHPLGRAYLFMLVSLSLFHGAHRFRYALVDLGLPWLGRRAWLFYGLATTGTVVCGWFVLRL